MASCMKLFDCHCHAHMGPLGVAPLLQTPLHPPTADGYPPLPLPGAATYLQEAVFAGAAIMSTHPRDFGAVNSAASALRKRPTCRGVAGYGIHPWFLHEVVLHSSNNEDGEDVVDEDWWLLEMKRHLIDHPDSIVGEIGLDGARWREVDYDANNSYDDVPKEQRRYNEEAKDDMMNNVHNCRRRILSCPMDMQRRAFERQLLLAAELQRPVSIHVVRAWGELFDSFDAVRELMEQRHSREEEQIAVDGEEPTTTKRSEKRRKRRLLTLPPKIYFHAFSGKAGIIPSILAMCEKGNVSKENVYFGFAPAIPNYYSPKTPSIMKQIGLRQLVLETDLEDASNGWEDLKRGVEGLAMALDMHVEDVAEQTYRNAERLYFEPL